MSRVVFMCGPSGSGKTTHARSLEEQGMVRLSFDLEAWARGVHPAHASAQVLREIDDVLRSRLLALVDQGAEVVLDFPFSTRAVREEYRDLLRPAGVVPETVFVDTEREIVLARLRARAGADADTVALTPRMAAAHVDGFERPDPDEGPLTVVDGAAPAPSD